MLLHKLKFHDNNYTNTVLQSLGTRNHNQHYPLNKGAISVHMYPYTKVI